MKAILSVAISVALLGACATPRPETAWGKPGASQFDYVTDLGACTAMAAMAGTGNGANTAGGLSGRNNSAPPTTGADVAKTAAQAGGPPSGAATPTGGGGVYRDSAPTDVANRAAAQQTIQQMAAKRLRNDALRTCYSERGYHEFRLTPEQSAHLGTLEKGSNEYLQYLSDIATDPALLETSVVAAPKQGS
jgi:hypothetical protein